jgi:thiol-disulfide isomerase/thioredoxin
MKTPLKNPWVVGLLGGWIMAAGTVLAADRTAGQILTDIDALKTPQFDASKQRDQAYVQEFMAKQQEAAAKRAALVGELYKVAPDHARLATLLPERWSSMLQTDRRSDAFAKEVSDVRSHTTNASLKVEASFFKALLGLIRANDSHDPIDMAAIDEFLKLAPKTDQRASMLLYNATMVTQDEQVKATLEDRLLKDYPQSRFAEPIKAVRRQREAIGKPFDLEFADAIKGSTVSIKNLKGKVVVVDFWATWCGPCVREMPHMKELYAKYRDQGVEFIGVSLDQPKEQGGLDKLTKYVKDNKIEWPQYYQGNGWQSEFSKSWGINSIPTMFLVDTEGKLFSIEARGKLDKLIPELLKKKGAPSSGTGVGAGGQ